MELYHSSWVRLGLRECQQVCFAWGIPTEHNGNILLLPPEVVRIFPNGESCLRLVRALAVETHENWLEQHRYLNMDDLHEHKKEALRRAA